MHIRSILPGLRSLLHPGRRNAEIAAELDTFYDASVSHKMQTGMSRADAERAARAEVRSAESVRHKVWAAGWESHFDALIKDAHYALRQMFRSPALTCVAILSLALGIGANTALFTVLNDLMLKQLPVRDPRMLVSFGDGFDSGTGVSSNPGPYDLFAYDFFRYVSADRAHFDGITAFASFTTQVSVRTGATSNGPATQAISHLVSGNFFSVLGANPILGRSLTPDDTAQEGRNAVAVLSHRYWQEALSADPNVIGRTLTIDGTTFTVVGVMPAAFYGVELNEQMPDMWLPITMQPQVMMQPSLLNPNGLIWIHILARRKPGVSVAQAQSWVTAQFQRFLFQDEGSTITALRRQQISGSYIPLLPGGSGLSHLRDQYQTPLTVLMVMVGVVLLIACANLANLLLAKAASREREFSARLALGASRGRIARQIFTEAIVLALIGGSFGLALAFWATRAIIQFIDGGAVRTALTATPDLRVLAFTFAICVATAILFGIAPALHAARSNVSGALNATARTAGSMASRPTRLLSRGLIVVQVTLSLVLLTVAGLLLRTLQNLRAQDLGINRTNVLLINTSPKFAGYPPERLNALYDRILTRIDALPGVRFAALSGGPPLSGGNWGSPITIDGHPPAPGDDNQNTYLNRVTTGYFETLGIPLLRGRTIQPNDNADAVKSVVVNKTFADKFFPNGDPIGHSFTIDDPAAPGVWHIVGIVRDSKRSSPNEKPSPFAFLAATQLTGNDQYAYWLQIRSAGDPATIAEEVRAALAEVDPNLPILKSLTISQQFDDRIGQQRFVSQLAAFFSFLALALACIGIYGVMTYNVVRRTSELGVRMALGAPRLTLLWTVLRESLLLLVVGVTLGVPVSLAASRFIKAGLFGVSPADPFTIAAAVCVVSACTLMGSFMPARRASRVDPMVALRYE